MGRFPLQYIIYEIKELFSRLLSVLNTLDSLNDRSTSSFYEIFKALSVSTLPSKTEGFENMERFPLQYIIYEIKELFSRPLSVLNTLDSLNDRSTKTFYEIFKALSVST